MTTQTRLLIATVLSVAFFIAYDFYFMPKKQLENNASINASNAAPALKEGILDPNDASNLCTHRHSYRKTALYDKEYRLTDP